MNPVVRRVALFILTAVFWAGSLAVALAAEKAEAPKASGSPQVAPPTAGAPAIPENADELKAPPVAPTNAQVPVSKPRVRLTAKMAEIQALHAVRDQAIAEKARALATASPATAAALQAEIGQMKLDLEIETLRIQARWARKENRIADAERIETAIEGILNPSVRVAPEFRPVPAASATR